jgi:hypothetical protein
VARNCKYSPSSVVIKPRRLGRSCRPSGSTVGQSFALETVAWIWVSNYMFELDLLVQIWLGKGREGEEVECWRCWRMGDGTYTRLRLQCPVVNVPQD